MENISDPTIVVAVLVFGTAIFSAIRNRMKSQLDKDIEQLKRCQKEVDRLRLELFD